MQTALSVRELSNASATGTHANRTSHLKKARSRPRAPNGTQGASNGTIRLRLDESHEVARDSCAVEPAIHGNHLAIQSFLQRVLHRPAVSEFNSATMRPGYEPADRLIVKNPKDRTITGHVQVESQSIRFGRSEIPVARIRDFAMLPEDRQRGFDDQLLAAAEDEAKKNGAMLMLARGEDHRFLRKSGWSTLGSDPVSLVSPQRLLGQLPPPAQPESPFYADKMPKWEVRIGRLTDVEAMASIYDAVLGNSYGSLMRGDEKWSWLISKRAHHRIYLFIENDQPLAYVVVRGGCVVELMDRTEGRGAARLLERVGADAIDQGRHSLRLHAPMDSPIHAWADQAGGQLFAPPVEDGWMVKILSKRTLLRRLANEMHRRKPKSLSELGVRIGGEELLIRRGVRSMKVTRGTSSKHQIGLTNRAAIQLFLGYRSVAELAESKELVASDPAALKAADELFPAVMLWRTSWDDASVLTR